MKQSTMVLISLIMISMLCLTGASVWAEDTYEVDPIHSSVVFKVGHLNIGTVFGMFTDFSGTIIADRENPEKSSVEMTVRAASVNTHVDKRDDHLRSNEFFNAALFPEIKFKSTGVKKIDDKTFEVTGNFNLHGITKELTVTVHFLGEGNDPWGGYRMGFETEFDIVRSEFGMTQHIPAAGDKARVILAVEAVKK
ncbi:MAG: YceI family protein [Desulfobacterales bacterium]|nr:YceI family protein [Desulfobacterales bacterium]